MFSFIFPVAPPIIKKQNLNEDSVIEAYFTDGKIFLHILDDEDLNSIPRFSEEDKSQN